MRRRLLTLGIVALAAILLAACTGGDAPAAAPSPSPTAEARPTVTSSPTEPSGTESGAAEAGETVQLEIGEPVPFPSDLAVIVEIGCDDCDRPPAGFSRIYRDASGEVRVEALFEPPDGVGHQDYIYGSMFAADGSDIVIAVCSGGYCGDVGSPVDPQVTLHRSRDGGVTWTELTTLAGPWAPYALQGGSIVLGSRYDADGNITQPHRFIREPSGEPVTPPSIGDEQSQPEATTDGELVWRTESGALIADSGDPVSGLRPVTLAWAFPEPSWRQVVQYVSVAEPDGEHVDDPIIVFTREWLRSAVQFGRSQLMATSYFPQDIPQGITYRSGLALVDLEAAVLHPIIELPAPTFGIRGPMAVQRGPFARVVAGAGSCLHVRAEPSAHAASLDCAADGVLLRRTGAAKDGWLPVTTPAGIEGWANTGLLE